MRKSGESSLERSARDPFRGRHVRRFIHATFDVSIPVSFFIDPIFLFTRETKDEMSTKKNLFKVVSSTFLRLLCAKSIFDALFSIQKVYM